MAADSWKSRPNSQNRKGIPSDVSAASDIAAFGLMGRSAAVSSLSARPLCPLSKGLAFSPALYTCEMESLSRDFDVLVLWQDFLSADGVQVLILKPKKRYWITLTNDKYLRRPSDLDRVSHAVS